MENNHAKYTRGELQELIVQKLGPQFVPKRFKIVTDTSDFFRVDYNDVVILAGKPYLIRKCEREGRFGLDDEPKYWVKRVIDLTDGSTKIIKLVFHEEIEARIGGMVFKCMRSPRKEALILDLIKGHKNFMQGESTRDSAGNIIRILEYINGKRIDDYILQSCVRHEEYFYTLFPSILNTYIGLIEAIKFLHDHNQKHGDIRRDHILIDRQTGNYRWIDFDYDYYHEANVFGYDVFGLGNILIFLAAGGDITIQRLEEEDPALLSRLSQDDMNIVFNNRVANLQMIYPYISDDLNYVLMHFSNGANLYYENCEQLLEDLNEVTVKND